MTRNLAHIPRRGPPGRVKAIRLGTTRVLLYLHVWPSERLVPVPAYRPRWRRRKSKLEPAILALAALSVFVMTLLAFWRMAKAY
ncbi:MAG: hypothetical protein C5B60_02530 [Chloroflexi bacterium]|nr:MAG: hypothetical protein C5B60_02530 [Chloroflexota bacterium]